MTSNGPCLCDEPQEFRILLIADFHQIPVGDSLDGLRVDVDSDEMGLRAEVMPQELQAASPIDADLQHASGSATVPLEVAFKDWEVVHPLVDRAACSVRREEPEQWAAREFFPVFASVEGNSIAFVDEMSRRTERAEHVPESAGLSRRAAVVPKRAQQHRSAIFIELG